MQNQGRNFWRVGLVLGEGLGLGFGSLCLIEANSIRREDFFGFSPWRGFSLVESLIFVSFVVSILFLIFV